MFTAVAVAAPHPQPSVGVCVVGSPADFNRTNRLLWHHFVLGLQPRKELRYIVVEAMNPSSDFVLDGAFHYDEWHVQPPNCTTAPFNQHACCALKPDALHPGTGFPEFRLFTQRLNCYDRLLAREKATETKFDVIAWIRADALVLEPMLPASFIVRGTPRIGLLHDHDDLEETFFVAPRSLSDAFAEQLREVHARPCRNNDVNELNGHIAQRMGRVMRGDFGSKVPWEAQHIMMTQLDGAISNCNRLNYHSFRGKIRSLRDGRLITGEEWCEEQVPPRA